MQAKYYDTLSDNNKVGTSEDGDVYVDIDLIGHDVGGHEIVRALASGGMGDTFLAMHKALQTHRVIKIIRDDCHDKEAVESRFRREALAMGKLQHAGVAQIFDFGQLKNGWPWLSMEYIEGPNLEQHIERRGPLGLASGLRVLLQLAQVLEYTHKAGIIHRDIKPANIMLRDGDVSQVKVIDFGLVRMISQEQMTKLTRDHQIMGSPPYMSPEQAEGLLALSPAIDIYSLAGIGFFVLSGQPVFNGASILELLYAHTHVAP